MGKYRFSITYKDLSNNPQTRDINIIGSKGAIVRTPYELPIMGYKTQLNGDLIVKGDDYQAIHDHYLNNKCENIILNIYETTEGIETLLLSGFIIPIKTTFNNGRCTAKLYTKFNDTYSQFDKKSKDVNNIFSVGATNEINILPVTAVYRVHYSVDTARATQEIYTIYTLTAGNFDYNYMLTGGVASGSTTSPTTLYNQIANPSTGFLAPYYLSADNYSITNKTEIFELATVPPSLRYTYDRDYIVYVVNGINFVAVPTSIRDKYQIDTATSYGNYISYNFDGVGANKNFISNGRKLNQVLTKFVTDLGLGLTLRSEFFQINPTTVTTTNYVTGANSEVDNLLIFQKSDVKRPLENRSWGQSGEITLSDLLDYLCKMFDLNYAIVGSTLRLEHLSWAGWTSFLGGGNLDLSSYKTLNQKDIEYIGTDIHDVEKMQFMEAFNIDFIGVPTTFDMNCLGNETSIEDIKDIPLITTDIFPCVYGAGHFFADIEGKTDAEMEQAKNNYIEDKGFCLIACSRTLSLSRYNVLIKQGILQEDGKLKPYPNNPLSVAHLFDAYHKHKAPLLNGVMNNVNTNFVNEIEKHQVSGITKCTNTANIGVNGNVITNVFPNTAIVESATISLDNNNINVTIKF